MNYLLLGEGAMNPWLETIGVILIAISGIFIGMFFSRFRSPWWVFGYIFPCLIIVILAVARCNNSLYFMQPFSLITTGRSRFAIFSLAVSMGFTVPLSRLPHRFEKLLVCLLMTVFITWFSVLPFLAPALLRNRLANLVTTLDSGGNCIQTTSYTCGPAAAVTALKRLGLPAEEGEIAVLSYTSPVIGTLPSCLSKALQNRYGNFGLKCRYRRFDSVDQLGNEGITLAVIRDAFLVDHCITVLKVSDDDVTVADPMTGIRLISRSKFEKIWRFSGIVLELDSTMNI